MKNNTTNVYRDLGRDFLSDAALLGGALGYAPRQVGQMLLQGGSVAYADSIAREMEAAQVSRCSEQLAAFRAAAEAYELPPGCREDPERLFRALQRAGRRARGRDGACPEEEPGGLAELNFLRNLAVVGAGLGYPPRILMELVFAGSSVDLVRVLAGEERVRSSRPLSDALSALAELAEDFVLPERFLRDPEALVRFMTRAADRVLA